MLTFQTSVSKKTQDQVDQKVQDQIFRISLPVVIGLQASGIILLAESKIMDFMRYVSPETAFLQKPKSRI